MARAERPLRPWSWTRIDGRNVFAVPTQSEIRVYDSADFILLHRLAPSGHCAPVALVRWSFFHGKLASLSSTQIMVHAPQRDPAARTRVTFVPIVNFRLGEARVAIRGLAFSRCADELLFCGRHVGVGKLDVRARAPDAYGGFCEDEPGDDRVLWEQHETASDVAKFSPSAYVFATLKIRQKSVQVWRMARCSPEPESSHALYDPGELQDGPRQSVARVEELAHPDPVVYFSWKPATTQWRSAHESDGTRKAQWFEPSRILLTCTSTRTIRIWTESIDTSGANGPVPCFTPVLVFEPPHPIDNYRWVLSKNRNISDESFRVVDDSKDQHTDWISGVDRHGILRLWRVVGIVSLAPSVEETSLRIKVNGEDDSQTGEGDAKQRQKKLVRLGEVCVMAYFSQNYFGMPSKFDIVLQRADHIILSLDVAVGGGDEPTCIKKKSWYRSHLGSISALSAHPSLPLIASVDAHPSENDTGASASTHEILVFWISFSAFSAESRLIPSGVLSCTDDLSSGENCGLKKDCGSVLCVQWVPTLHFDATPLLLVVFESGVISVYGRSANAAGVVSSPIKPMPAQRRRLLRSPSLSPWTLYDYETGESRAEYEIALVKPASTQLGLHLEGKDGKLLVSRVSSSDSSIKQIVAGDELVGINNKSVVGKDPEDVLVLIDLVPPEDTLLMRFRATSVSSRQESTEESTPTEELSTEASAGSERFKPIDDRIGPPPSVSFMSKYSGGASDESSTTEGSDQQLEEPAAELRRGLAPMLEEQGSLSPRDSDTVVHAGSVSTYGGWNQLLHVKAAPSLSSLCVCPAYADDGEYIPDAVVIFGITSLPGKLCAWKGVRGSVSHSFELAPLQIQEGSIERKRDITSIAGERDYRQRAFTSKRAEGHDGLNSLLFIGDAAGGIEHWRCHISGEGINFTMMSSCKVSLNRLPASPLDNAGEMSTSPSSFCRRGYVSTGQANEPGISTTVTAKPLGVRHIEVDDPNRVAVLHTERPDELHVFEGESGLGILRLEEFIPSNGRGNVLGFSWCNSHVEFNVDALAVRYESAMVIYQYDMNLHRWAQIGEDIVSPLSIFDCTRDSSALLIGGGYVQAADAAKSPSQHRFTISNEMPVVMGKWDEPGSLLQYSMDWKAAESPQKLPVWHPYVILTTLFGMHARVGEKDTSLAGDSPTYEFSRAFKDAIQMLKLLAKVIEDDTSARASARSGILSYTATVSSRTDTDTDSDTDTANGIDFGLARGGVRDSIGRYSTSVHRSADMDKAENLFAMPAHNSSRSNQRGFDYLAQREATDATANEAHSMAPAEMVVVETAVDTLLLGKDHALATNASVLFTSFSEEHLLEMKAILRYVEAIQALGFDLDASPADLGAKRFFSMNLFARSLKSVMVEHTASDSITAPQVESYNNRGASNKEEEVSSWCPGLGEAPSSGFLWALHSDAQQFLWEHCIQAEMSWEDLRPMWLGLWVKDVKDLRGVIERFAKLSYSRTKDAMSICLYYVALGKTNVLSALAKFSRSDRNKTLASFLENDFSQERWCNAAIRNAYSLLGKQHYEEAAAFFLLCEPPRIQEAVRVLAVRLADPSLALVIARLVEYRTNDSFRYDFISTAGQSEITPAGNVAKELLEQEVIPLFRRKRERWLESCALWWLEDFEQACAVLLPQAQEVDVYADKRDFSCESDDVMANAARATHFYVNLTSVTIYFQYLHSSVNSPMLNWAMKKMQQQAFPGTSLASVTSSKHRHQLATHADIEHAFSFAAYVCKRSGLSDTALVEMLQARHLVNIHARFEISALESTSDKSTGVLDREQELEFAEQPTSPRFRSSRKNHWRRASDLSCITSSSHSPDRATLGLSPRRRMSDLNQSLSLLNIDLAAKDDKLSPLRRANTANWSNLLQSEKSIPSAPWLKAQIADIECRRWSSSAFVGKMIGIRVAREMISHFRADLNVWFRHDGIDDSEPATTPAATASLPQKRHRRSKLHKDFLAELCTPLCEQFQVDRKYVYEAALAVMHPHAYLHIVEVCFLLSELKRTTTLRKWIQYVSLSMLHSCSTFASCSITEDVYRDWEGLTIQLCYILNLDAEGQINISPLVVAYINVAVRTGAIFLGWARQRSDLVREAVSLPFYTQFTNKESFPGMSFSSLSSFAFEKNVRLIRSLERGVDAKRSTSKRGINRSFVKNFGFIFLGTVASHVLDEESISLLSWGGMDKSTNHHQFKIRKMYTLILMVSVLRTTYARATLFLGTFQDVREEEERKDDEGELDISSSLFTPRKLWKALGEGPLDGIKRWYALIESHLRCEFDYSVKEVQCLCGLYGLDNAALGCTTIGNMNGKWKGDQEGLGAGSGEDRVDSSEQEFGCGGMDTDAHNGHCEMDQPITLGAFLYDIGMSRELHSTMVKTSDDYVLLLMQSAGFGVPMTQRRFRVDPRVYTKSFLLGDAFDWFKRHEIFASGADDNDDSSDYSITKGQAFLERCCKHRKLRLLVAHRGEDTQMFPLDPHVTSSRSRSRTHSNVSDASIPTGVACSKLGIHSTHSVPEELRRQSMMFVDPWEVEAEWNVRRYMHNMEMPLHVELGWDRLSPICLETCDDIIESVFEDPDLVAMWKATGGEGWLVTAITQYQLDGVHSYRTHHQYKRLGLDKEDEPRIPFLVEAHSRAQRNAMFQEAGLPHRFVGVVTVELVEAKELVSCGWLTQWSNAYVFLELVHPGEKPKKTAEEWSLQTYRSKVGEGGVNPQWNPPDNKFAFRFAIPTHSTHVHSTKGASSGGAADRSARRAARQLWDARITETNRASVDALDTLSSSVFSGPPTVLRCTVYQKNKVLSHQFMGRGEVSLNELTSGSPMDCWLPLEDTASGSVHVRIALSFPLMCSFTAGKHELEGLR